MRAQKVSTHVDQLATALMLTVLLLTDVCHVNSVAAADHMFTFHMQITKRCGIIFTYFLQGTLRL